MSEFPLRRAQLIRPSGPGSLQTSTDGITGMVCGIDHWIDSKDRFFDVSEFEIYDERRLCDALGVKYLIRPPDHRKPFGRKTSDEINMYIKLPAVRFPQFHWCKTCLSLEPISPHIKGRVVCKTCEIKRQIDTSKKKFNRYMIQVAFTAMCEGGHIQDFPWREWVHKSVDPNCSRKLTAEFLGATLEGQKVKCECGTERNLAGIFGGIETPGGQTFLSKNLDSTRPYLCRGCSPWLDDFQGNGCDAQLVGGLTGAVNAYYPYIRSAIFLPNEVDGVDKKLMEALQLPGPQTLLTLLSAGATPSIGIATILIASEGIHFLGYSAEQIARAIEGIKNNHSAVVAPSAVADDWRIALKAPEYKVFVSAQSSIPSMLKLRKNDLSSYNAKGVVRQRANGLTLVERLRETRALTGFGRVKPNPHIPLAQNKALLRRSTTRQRDWLPAYEVYGEGIFFDFNTEHLVAWSQGAEVIERVKLLKSSPYFQKDYPNCKDDTFLPRFVALHTLSHILINQLVFDCGYTAASLSERLYCTDESTALPSMNGLLIYTASGDSEGSMGGLVRMGEPDELDRVFEAALDNARFCSSDPICMELGAEGQGPNSMNLAACHSCALVPETSCEFFNHYLDRGLIIGVPGNLSLGLFNV